jgi:hypothetical protein
MVEMKLSLALPSIPALIFLALSGAPLPAELLTHLPLDGDLLDAHSDNDGTFFGGLEPVFEDGFDGTAGGALTLDGVDDYVQLTYAGDLPLSHQPTFTVAMWVKGLPQSDKRVFAESSDTLGNPLFTLGTHNTAADGTVDSFIRSSTVTIRNHYHSTGTAFDGTWHHIAWVDAQGVVVLYIDGVPDATVFDYPRPAPEMAITTLGGIYRPTQATTTCCFFTGAIDEVYLYDHALTAEEVLALVPGGGCPDEGDTTCNRIDIIAEPGTGGPGDYTFESPEAQDTSGDIILYAFKADDGKGTVLTSGPDILATATFRLLEGTWTVSVTVDDDLNCDDTSPNMTCSQVVEVTCPAEGDTTCLGIEVVGPTGNLPGTYTVTCVGGVDAGGDLVQYTYKADNGIDPPIVRGPYLELPEILMTLGPGSWTISVTVDDDLLCPDVAAAGTCSTNLVIATPASDLVSRWKFDGDLLDSQPSANDGVFVGDVEPLFAPDMFGTDPGAIVLDGIDDEVQIQQVSNLPIYANKAYTIAMWVNGPALQSDRRVYSEGNSLAAAGAALPHPQKINPLFNIGTHNGGADGTVDLFVRGDLGENPVNHRHSFLTAFDDTWHHIAFVDDGVFARLYVDAVRDPTDFRFTRPSMTLDTTTIGGIQRAEPTHWFQGQIDDVRAYNFALSPTEIEALVPEREGCPGDADTTVAQLAVEGPDRNFPGPYTFTAVGAADVSGDPILYTFVAETADGEYIQVGPAADDAGTVRLWAGTWTVSVTVDDDLRCRDRALDSSVSTTVVVVDPPKVLTSWWTFEGDLDDWGVGGNHGSTVGGGAPTFGPGPDGGANDAICLDGLSDNFVRADIAWGLPVYNNTLTAYSIAAWVKGPPQNDRRIYSETSSLTTNTLINLGTQAAGTTGQVDLYIRNADNAAVLPHTLSQGIAFDNTWHHIAWVDARGDAALFIDGVRDATDFRYTRQEIDVDIVTIGGILRATACCRFEGCIDDVRVYNFALSQDDIDAVIAGTEPPARPTGLAVISGDRQISLNWDDVAGAMSYMVYRRTEGGTYAATPDSPVSGSAAVDTGLTNGTAYFYRVAAVGIGGEGPRSDPEISAVPGGVIPGFRRGDADGNGKLDLTDAISTLQFLYMGYTAPECKDAADTDDSGKLDLTDAISSLQFQFMGGTPPANPGPTSCGPDPTPGDEYTECIYTKC